MASSRRGFFVPPERIRNDLFRELLAIELELRGKSGPLPASSEYHARFPDRQEHIRWVFARVAGERPAMALKNKFGGRAVVTGTPRP
jgi:hypothetical protein